MLQVVQLICEDFRLDVDGKPIVTGVMPSVAHLDGDEEEITFLAVTLFSVEELVDKFDASLSILQNDLDGAELSSQTFSRTFERPEEEDPFVGERWNASAVLRITEVVRRNTVMEVRATGRDFDTKTSVKFI